MSVRRETGRDGLPRLEFDHPSGSTAELYLHGAHVTSWVPSGGSEGLFVSRAATFRPGTSIRGGIPVIFPQFAGLGPLPKHGFARVQQWEWSGPEGGQSRATLRLRDSEESRLLWQHRFLALLSVELDARSLTVRLEVHNTDSRPFSFTCALHSYLRVADVRSAALHGLQGVPFRSAPEGVDGLPDPEPELTFPGPMDRIYLGAPAEIRVADRAGGREIRVRSSGFRDAVVWNPWEERAAMLQDMEAQEYREMVCVEAAQVGSPVWLTPGGQWAGEQRLEI